MKNPPLLRGFKPFGIPSSGKDFISIQFEEFEALKLADYENLTHAEAAERMDISRPTFTRIYDHLRKKLARAFVEGIQIVVEGGKVMLDKQWFRCNSCYHLFYLDFDSKKKCLHCKSMDIEHINKTLRNWKTGFGTGAYNRKRGRPDACICLGCGYRIPHQAGTPCYQLKCPKCDITLMRE
ncbi:MAG: DUF134 domain-containing protein [Bacteroidales bacterium]|nr:MAG: DUF134 domain-containing protein [Bacteroidales bacterium]